MADQTTGSLPAVQEAAIGDLPAIADLYDDTLIPVEQQGEARHMTGAQWKAYGAAAAAKYTEAAKDSADRAEKAAIKQPITKNGTWWIWDPETNAYVDTGDSSLGEQGPQGIQGIQGEQGPPGNLLYATFAVDPYTGVLTMCAPDDYDGPQFVLNGSYLEVVVNG